MSDPTPINEESPVPNFVWLTHIGAYSPEPDSLAVPKLAIIDGCRVRFIGLLFFFFRESS